MSNLTFFNCAELLRKVKWRPGWELSLQQEENFGQPHAELSLRMSGLVEDTYTSKPKAIAHRHTLPAVEFYRTPLDFLTEVLRALAPHQSETEA